MLFALATSVLVGLLIFAGGIILTVGLIAWLTRKTIRVIDGEPPVGGLGGARGL